eukprot:scaffold114_cov361-Pinguiococcus_pyrenoidosus.AAC.8
MQLSIQLMARCPKPRDSKAAEARADLLSRLLFARIRFRGHSKRNKRAKFEIFTAGDGHAAPP